MTPREERDREARRHEQRLNMARAERLADRKGWSLAKAAKVLRDDHRAAKRAAHGEITPAAALRSVSADVRAREVRS